MLKHQELYTQDPREIAAYLSTIIKSPLSWLEDEDREAIWDEASRRFSERCGRSGTSHAPVWKNSELTPWLSYGRDHPPVALRE